MTTAFLLPFIIWNKIFAFTSLATFKAQKKIMKATLDGRVIHKLKF